MNAASPPPPLLSPDWYRLAHLKPRLRSGVRVSRHQLRGETWFMLTDPVSGRHHRFNDLAYALIGACDGQTPIDAIWSSHVAAQGDSAPTQADAIRVFAQAFAANLFTGDVTPDVAVIARAYSRTQGQQRRSRLNPLSFRVPLWDPDRFLAAHHHRLAWLFSRHAAWAIGALLLLGAVLLAVHADDVARHARQELGSGRMLLLMWLVYPVMKALHEFAHAFAVKHHGGEVHEMGITLMMLTPVPYMDASASIAFTSKHRRMLVAGAGILVEAVLASLALPLLLLAEPGVLKDLAFVIVFIGALSTLVINGNPLLRFDGYHVLCDAAELPNLAPRSARWWQTLFKRQVLRLRHLRFGTLSRGEESWLWCYAPLSNVYRLLISATLVLVAARWHPSAGLALLALLAWQMAAAPAWAAWRWLRTSPELRGRRHRAMATASMLAAALLAAVLLVPLPHRTHAPGLVWLPDDALARTSSEGFVSAFFVTDGQPVSAGMPMLQLVNETLELELANTDAELARKRVERALQFEASARRTADADEALTRLQTTRDRLWQRVQGLTIRAGMNGRVTIDSARVRLGQMLAQGEVVAQVLPPGQPLVRALVHNQDIALVRDQLLRNQPGAIQVQLPHQGGAQRALLAAQTPLASTTLPTRALGESAGGSIALDAADSSGRTAREPLFQLDLRLPDAGLAPIGARVLVTFSHAPASAAERGLRFLRQSFLRHFAR